MTPILVMLVNVLRILIISFLWSNRETKGESNVMGLIVDFFNDSAISELKKLFTNAFLL